MNIQYISDIHLENIYYQPLEFAKEFIEPKSDVLVLAGDISKFSYYWKDDIFWDWCSENFEHTIYVPGNHEYYKAIMLKNESLNENIRNNVYLLNNSCKEIYFVNFICSTLWSNPLDRYVNQIVRGIADFKYIKCEGTPDNLFTIPFMKTLHKQSKEFIFSNVKENMTNIVVTHFVPSYLCIHPRFAGDSLNSYFNANLDEYIDESNIDYWIYGHSHASVNDIKIGNTLLTANMLGYEYEISRDFKPKYINIKNI